MQLARQKQWLICPLAARPSNWPENWPFPAMSAWPPGYPAKYGGNVHLNARYEDLTGALLIETLDSYNEPTDELSSQFFQIRAHDGDTLVRLRTKQEVVWSEGLLLGIDGTRAQAVLEFEQKSMLTLQILLYGHDGLGAMLSVHG